MRRAALLRACYGLVLLLAPSTVVERLSRGSAGRVVTVTRGLLGVRHIAQAFLLSNRDGHVWRIISAVVDCLHISTMVPVIIFDDEHRTLASFSAFANLLFAIADADDN